MPDVLISPLGVIVTTTEIFALYLSIRFKTEYCAKLSLFVVALCFGNDILNGNERSIFDYSVFTVSASAFALSLMKEKYLELDNF
ncbi:hypothetical protein [Maribacter sp. HTCC2170]|uniref:hypothetical protein n=1 Tax=Maribacter sp. (strain HTCC2170 / KCCM 42371) TaxID=313603 RepID=UPI00006BB119|nr:hypothetical protein [Maribacter sp. HTCC2170]EAQ99631.1 hypothetical protein FB2170_00210 [Maribacter sp. HTCC2170]